MAKAPIGNVSSRVKSRRDSVSNSPKGEIKSTRHIQVVTERGDSRHGVEGVDNLPADQLKEEARRFRLEATRRRPRGRWCGILSAVLQSTLPAWANIVVIISLIFGGCCANVFALEAIIIDDPGSGALITFAQFLIIAVLTFPNVLSLSAGLKSFFTSKPVVPMRSWIIYTAFFMTVNLLNNCAFMFKISVPLHIIVRSAGPVASLVIGYLYNSKSYTRTQIFSVAMLSTGVVVAALADANAQGKSLDIGLTTNDDGSSRIMSIVAFTVLGLAMVLAAFQGVYADRLYQKHGRNNWREGLFYSHALSLPFFVTTYSKLIPQFNALAASPSILDMIQTSTLFSSHILTNSTSSLPPMIPTGISQSFTSHIATSAFPFIYSLATHPLLEPILSKIPVKIAYLVINALTQYLCIRGVYLLSAKTSSLTVVIVLNIRKLVSLILSVYLFGNTLSVGVLMGAAVVFMAGAIYANEGARLGNKQKKEKVG